MSRYKFGTKPIDIVEKDGPRLEPCPTLRHAIEVAAKREERSMGSMLRIFAREGLARRGFMLVDDVSAKQFAEIDA